MLGTRKQINESLTSIILFLRLYQTFEIGQLVNICTLLDQESSLYDDKVLSTMLAQFIYHVNEENKKNHTEQQYLALIIVESILYNLYRRNTKNCLNSSIYSNSLMISSSSQIGFNDQSVQSIKHYESIQEQLSVNFTNFVFDFISEAQMIKKLKQMIERGARKAGQGVNQTQRYVDILLDTIQYILNHEGKLEKYKDFENIKQVVSNKNTVISSHFEKKTLKSIIPDVNKIIFSSKLNRILSLLEQAPDKIYFSLIHIYLAQSSDEQINKRKMAKEAKYFSGIGFTGQQMILNLTWAYIQSIQNKNQLFESSKNPFFRLIQAYLMCMYLPVFRSFNQVVAKCCKFDFTQSSQFYKICQTTINKDLYQFIEKLPQDLLEYLRLVYLITISVEQKSSKKQIPTNISSVALNGVKKLFIYSLLVRPILIQTFYSEGVDLDKYEEVCNYIINLFFKSSLKKYQSTSSQFQLISNLTKSISKLLDQKILSSGQVQANGYLQQFEKSSDSRSYILQQPILNHNYELLGELIKSIQFTPKDLKQFEMHKKSFLTDRVEFNQTQAFTVQSLNNTNGHMPHLNFISPREAWSPMNRAKKESLDFNQSMEILQVEQGVGHAIGFTITSVYGYGEDAISPVKDEIDFFTWMTIGGNRDYEQKAIQITNQTKRRKSYKRQFTTFPKQKVRQIQKLYQKFDKIIL